MASRSSDARPARAGAGAHRPATGTIALLLIVLPTAFPPADGGEEKARIASALDKEIAALQKELESVQGEERSATGEIELLSTKEALSRRRWQRATLDREEVVRQVQEEGARSVELARAVDSGRAKAREALREAYKQSAVPEYASLFSVESPSDLLGAYQSLDILARRQAEAATGYQRSLLESEASIERLHQKKAELDSAIRVAGLEEAQLAQDRSARLALLDRLRKDKALQSEALDELTRAMSSLGESLDAVPTEGRPLPVRIAFSRLQGGLPWPAPGAIQVPFGSVRNPRFGTLTPHPGVDLRVGAAAIVRAVGAGRVVLNRRYGSYGRTVVIDHGERYLSVYARLAAASVSEGDDVVPGQEVGFAGEADAEGKSLIYFEIRHQGKALDPAEWLRRGGPRSRAGGSR